MSRPQSLQRSLPGLWRIARHLGPHLSKQTALIGGSGLALLAEVVLRLLEPWPLKFIFDRMVATSSAGGMSGIALIDALDTSALLTLAALGVVLIAGLRALAAYGSTVGFALVGNRVLSDVRYRLFRHLQELSLSFHNKARGGDLTVRVVSDIGLLQDVASNALLPLVANILVLVGMLGLMLWLNVELTLLALLTVPLFWLSTVRLSRRIHTVSREQRRRDGAMAATVAESIGAIKLVQAYSLQRQFAQAFARQNKKGLRDGVKGKRLAAHLERTTDLLIAVGTALVLWYGTQLVLSERLTPGDLLVFLAYLKNAFKPVRDFAKYAGRLAKAAAAGERVFDLLDHEPEVRDLPGARPASSFRGMVRFEDVSFAYDDGQPVLQHVDFTVEPGQCVALVGPSGSGKSTLVSLLLRLYDPTQGRVLIDGEDIRMYSLESLRAQMSVVLQDSLLFAASVRDNIAYGAPDATPERVEFAARLASAHAFIQALPSGYDTVLAERGATLSGGQRQRIAIARAAIRGAPILLLDEPTAGLDEENQRAVVDALDRLARGRTTFLVTHDLLHASRADLILYLEGGQVLERGSHAQLMRANGRYASLYKLQAAGRIRGARKGMLALIR